MRHRLFLYGTLQPRLGTRMGDWVAERIVERAPATAPGALFAIGSGDGWFPAMLPSSRRRVHGTLCTLDLSRAELAQLDRYEGPEYRRLAFRVLTERALATAQAYLWRAALPDGAVAIASGDFPGWLEAGDRRAFTALRNGH